MLYAIVDIETTGGSAEWHKITEIAIFLHNGNEIIDSFQTLINPQKLIPPNITALTGITNEMVENAPLFEEIADQIYDFTKDTVFVAHNVNFDYSFVKKEFERIGINYDRKRLCTVRLSRKLIPGFKSYSLGRLCGQIGISIKDRHRAGGDAEATAELFTILANKTLFQETLNHFLKKNSKEYCLPGNIDKTMFEKLPETTGVYLFYDDKGKVIYVGKALKIKTRVYEHFSSSTHTKTKTLFHNSIHDFTFEETGNEFIALLLENELIKKHYPKYNKTNKSFDLNTGIFKYEDQNGFFRLSIAKSGKKDNPLLTFSSDAEAINFILNKIKTHQLCMKLTGILPSKSSCPTDMNEMQICHQVCHESTSAEEYNMRFEKAFDTINAQKSFVLKMKGRNNNEIGVVMLEKGRFIGYGFIDKSISITNIPELKPYINPCYDTKDAQSIIEKFKHSHDIQKIYF